MTNIWDPEHVVDGQLALRLIQEQCTDLTIKSIKLLGVGFDNTVYLINNQYVFRFPRRSIAVTLLQHEIAALPLLAPKLSVAIPLPQWIGKPTHDYPWPFMGYTMLPGQTACQAQLSDEDRKNLIIPIARFLSTLHAVNIQEFKDILPVGTNRLDKIKLSEKGKQNLVELQQLGLLQSINSFDYIFDTAASLPDPVATTLVHGDFYIRHLLLNQKHELTSIIDWGDIHIGDQAIDLAFVHSFFPKEMHNAFKQEYGSISQDTWHLARLRALYTNTYLALYGFKEDDAVLLREALLAFDYMKK